MGRLFVVSGPSGAGKDSIIEGLQRKGLKFYVVITTTSRPMRENEKQGHPYFFISKREFKRKIDCGELFEWANVYNHYYGSTKQEVEKALEDYDIVILKIDPQGGRSIKKIIPRAITIFIVPPSFDLLEERLRMRGQDSDEVINRRLKVARKELAHLLDWDYVVVNEEEALGQAVAEVMNIIRIN